MKILQICHKPPLPALDGGCIAIHNITKGLLACGHDVKVLSITTPKHPLQPGKIPQEYLQETHFESVFIDTKIKPYHALLSLIKKESYHVSRFISKEFDRKLISVLQGEYFDIVQLESIFVAPYISTIRAHSNAKIVLRTHNVEHKIWERFIVQQKNILKRTVLKKMVEQLRRYELSVFDHIDGFLAISEPDYLFFHHSFPHLHGTMIPAGIDMENYEADENYIPSGKPELFHIGSMNWMPNIEGLEWFFKEVWDKILQKFPDLTFTLAGRHFPKSWEHLSIPNVIMEGEVDNANQFILSKDIMIVPLLSGSGVRIKILEGMALGKTVITTPIGAEGLDIENGKNIFIAHTPREFVEIIEKCINTPDICKIIGENARRYVALNHNNQIITTHIISLYHELLRAGI